MKTLAISVGVGVALLAPFGLRALPVQAASERQETPPAAKLVHQTLQREAGGEVANRAELLEPALAQSPNCDTARWHSGYFYHRKLKQWLRWDDAAQRAADDDQLANYRKLRGRYGQSAEGRADLARWCAKQHLDDQARAHWTEVLALSPDHQEARQQLGYQLINGTWISQAEVGQARQRVESIQASLRRWTPVLTKICKRLDGPYRRARELAQQELAVIKDPDAVPAIEAVLCRQDEPMALRGIDVLKNMQSAEAAGALAWQAICSPSDSVRTAAAAALRDQRKHDYVPLLLRAMVAPIQARYSLYNTPDGGFFARRALYQDGPEQRLLAVADLARPNVVIPSGRSIGQNELKQNPALRDQERRLRIEDRERQLIAMADARDKAIARARQEQAAIAAHNLFTANLNFRLCSLLTEATGDAGPTSPDGWYTWWDTYNEVTPPPEKPTRFTYQYGNVPVVTYGEAASIIHPSCLAAGTQVWTELGPVPVETIRVGDRVLACDCQTGEIQLKPVLQTIINPGKPLFGLHLADERLEVTGGHVFWVSGRGWIKSRELQRAMRLHTLTGTVELARIESCAPADTYNLVVADFHSYFAGRQQFLTHDNTIRRPTTCVVPGLPAHLVAKSN